MKYLFILGRNVELSLAELNSIFNNMVQIHDNSVLIEIEDLKENFIETLGGTIAIGEVLCGVDEIDKEIIYYGKENNFNYVVWDFSEKTLEVSEYLKKRFRKEKLKATEKRFTSFISSQEGEKIPNIGSKRINEQYFVFENYFGKIIQKCDYKEIEKRDMEKPFKRESLSISPRLAKIMINLSKTNNSLVDAFCGIGVILQEALIQGIKVIGIDKDKKAIDNAIKNLKWFGFSKENYELINFDSRKVNISKVDSMVSEPYLGEILKKIPKKGDAEKTLRIFEKLIIEVLNNLKKEVSNRFVFTAPLIRIGKERLNCNYNKILMETDLKLVEGFPIKEFRENQVVGREIFVLEQSL